MIAKLWVYFTKILLVHTYVQWSFEAKIQRSAREVQCHHEGEYKHKYSQLYKYNKLSALLSNEASRKEGFLASSIYKVVYEYC